MINKEGGSMKGLLLEYKYRIMESGIKYVDFGYFLILQLIIGFFWIWYWWGCFVSTFGNTNQ